MPFIGSPRQDMPKRYLFSLKEDCELVDITGKVIRDDKKVNIDQQQQPILQRLGLSEEQWLTLISKFEKHFCYAGGAKRIMNQFKEHTGLQLIWGMGKAKILLRCANFNKLAH